MIFAVKLNLTVVMLIKKYQDFRYKHVNHLLTLLTGYREITRAHAQTHTHPTHIYTHTRTHAHARMHALTYTHIYILRGFFIVNNQ